VFSRVVVLVLELKQYPNSLELIKVVDSDARRIEFPKNAIYENEYLLFLIRLGIMIMIRITGINSDKIYIAISHSNMYMQNLQLFYNKL